MNWRAVRAIYRTRWRGPSARSSRASSRPVISTSLYFVVFGTAIGSRIEEVEGVAYGAFIVPGLIMLTVLMQSISNASFGIYFPKFIGTIYEILSAPVSFLEIVIGYVGAAATKSFIIGLIIFATAHLFVTLPVHHPLAMLGFLALTCISFSLFGFIIGIWAKNFEQLQLVPLLVVSPLVFLGGSLLLDHHAAAALAEDHPLQPGGLPDLRLPLGLLRHRRRRRRPQPRRDRSSSPWPASPSSGGSSAPAGASAPRRHPPPPRRAARARSCRPRRPRGAPAGRRAAGRARRRAA